MAESSKKDADREEKLHSHYRKTLWIYWTLLGLGLWLIVSPFSLGYLNENIWVDPSGGRGVWFSTETHTQLRAWLMSVSDVVSGFILLVFSWRALTPNRPYSLWVCCGVGVWLNFAPLLFWAPTSAGYLNDTLTGVIIIALTVLIPGMPNMIKFMKMGGDLPKGWSYNPSSWPQRWIMIATGFIGWLVSRYLATYQLGYSEFVADPFFGFLEGTQKVLDSKMSHAWPISDAGLGALSYTFEFLMGWMGAPSRWRTMPWMVTFFGILVIPLGLTHILLVISQPVVVGAWCSFCLLAALIMLPMIPLEIDEVFAMLQHLKEAKKRGDHKGSLWKIFWRGGEGKDYDTDQRTPELMKFPQKKLGLLKSTLWGVSASRPLVITGLIGLVSMFAPLVVGGVKPVTDIFHLSGALVVTVSVISMGEIIRSLRFLNLPIAGYLALAPWVSASPNALQGGVAFVLALSIAVFSLPKGKITEKFGAWQKIIV